MTDWRLINQAFIGINWLKIINDANNADRTLRELLHEREAAVYLPGERVLNIGVLMMACYILFVYVRENEYQTLDFAKIDISDFTINSQDGNNNASEQLCRRLRNAVAHSRFKVDHDHNLIIFNDERNGADRIEFQIGIVELGTFIDNFIIEVNNQNIAKIQTV
ncbi:MAG: HEPN family nuclease [Bacteroidia bacterium]